jgi:hypothetical protein
LLPRNGTLALSSYEEAPMPKVGNKNYAYTPAGKKAAAAAMKKKKAVKGKKKK